MDLKLIIYFNYSPFPFVTFWSQSRLIIRGFVSLSLSLSLSAFPLTCNIPSVCIVGGFFSIPDGIEGNNGVTISE